MIASALAIKFGILEWGKVDLNSTFFEFFARISSLFFSGPSPTKINLTGSSAKYLAALIILSSPLALPCEPA